MPEIQEALPKYVQIANHIREQIARGELRPGEDVPSERELAQSWRVARPTATRALEYLRNQGLVESRRGSGTYVRPSPAIPTGRQRYQQATDPAAQGSESVEYLPTEVVPAPDHVVTGLRLPGAVPVIVHTRLVRSSERTPLEITTSWFAASLADQVPTLMTPERITGAVHHHIAEVTGRTAVYARDVTSARLAAAGERELLELAKGSAVLAYRITLYDSADLPIQLDDATYPPDRWAFPQEYPLH